MNLTIAEEHLLTNNNLKKEDILFLLEKTNNYHSNYSEFYFQSKFYESWILENKIIKNGSYDINQGIGIRIINEKKTGFSYTDQLNINNIKKSIEAASYIINEKKNIKPYILYPKKKICPYKTNNPLSEINNQDKINLLNRIDYIARSYDSRVCNVNVKLSGIYEIILIIATDNTIEADLRPLVQLSINVQVKDLGKREYGYKNIGGRFGYNFFMKNFNDKIKVDFYAQETVKIALNNLSSIEAPAGTMPVVLGSGSPGILLHEAIGHGLEGDFNRKKNSVFNDKIGKIVASPLCTIIDDGTIKESHGSLSIDDEGTPCQYNILIEKGILKNYMQDKLNAYLMKMNTTGNGRRESYAHLPMPRMTNTYMISGKSTKKEIISSIDYGLYAKSFSGGQVDITSGNFVFSTSEAYLIINGQIKEPVKNATLIGSGIEVMKNISMVGNDFLLSDNIGMCGKNGQNVPVGIGQPTLKVESITVGGTK
ncbi:metalloprotease TldD [Sodalis-like secondary symbiont of Drepanosiphum platanoidis]|uniref:metalloprotease TldD n=1 Tax=Sodalis-like secondary symbiont of Drepanosiphum platanoidis TaxID=2994493 RepID=UPI00346449DA